MAAFALAGVSLPFLRIEGCGGQENAVLLAPTLDCCNVCVGSDVDAFGLKIVGPVAVKSLKMWEGDHLGKVGKECFRIVIPQFHIGVVEEAFEDCAGDIRCLVACGSLVNGFCSEGERKHTSAKEKSYEREDHVVTEILRKEEHP